MYNILMVYEKPKCIWVFIQQAHTLIWTIKFLMLQATLSLSSQADLFSYGNVAIAHWVTLISAGTSWLLENLEFHEVCRILIISLESPHTNFTCRCRRQQIRSNRIPPHEVHIIIASRPLKYSIPIQDASFRTFLVNSVTRRLDLRPRKQWGLLPHKWSGRQLWGTPPHGAFIRQLLISSQANQLKSLVPDLLSRYAAFPFSLRRGRYWGM